jgi:hypothetical protein
MQMAISTMETGKIISVMVLGPTSMLMDRNMLVNGKRKR